LKIIPSDILNKQQWDQIINALSKIDEPKISLNGAAFRINKN